MFNFQEESFINDPYPTYAFLRKNGPIWIPLNEDYESSGLWLFGKYDDAVKIFKDIEHTSKNFRPIKKNQLHSSFDLHLLNQDGKDHLRLRKLSAASFSTSNLKTIETLIFKIVDRLYEELPKNGQVIDLVTDFCEMLPVLVITHLMGLPETDIALYRRWAKSIIIDSFSLDASNKHNRQEAINEISVYFDWMLKSDNTISRDGLLSIYLRAYNEGVISREEFVGMASFMLLAGHETTINFIGNGLLLFKQHPEQLKLLLDVPNMWGAAIDEVLRFESPTQRSTYRVIKQPIEVGGKIVYPGQQIAVIIGSANRDELVFEHADYFDINRKNNCHLAFGAGVHVCQGRNLARLEASISFKKFAPVLHRIKICDDLPSWQKNSFLRGLESFNVRFT